MPPVTQPITPPMASKAPKTSGGAKTFLLGFAGAALAVVIGFGGFGIYTASTNADPGASTTLGGSGGSTINVTNED
ncbi:MAG: peptidase S1, partial [Raoultibacter sp.]